LRERFGPQCTGKGCKIPDKASAQILRKAARYRDGLAATLSRRVGTKAVMRTRYIQPPYGPHLPDRLRNEGWWLDFSQQPSIGSAADMRVAEHFTKSEIYDRND